MGVAVLQAYPPPPDKTVQQAVEILQGRILNYELELIALDIGPTMHFLYICVADIPTKYLLCGRQDVSMAFCGDSL